MKPRRVRVEFLIETDMATNAIKQDIRDVLHKQIGIISNIKARSADVPSNLWITFNDAIPYLGQLRINLKNLKFNIKQNEYWNNAMSCLDEFEKYLDLSLSEKERP